MSPTRASPLAVVFNLVAIHQRLSVFNHLEADWRAHSEAQQEAEAVVASRLKAFLLAVKLLTRF